MGALCRIGYRGRRSIQRICRTISSFFAARLFAARSLRIPSSLPLQLWGQVPTPDFTASPGGCQRHRSAENARPAALAQSLPPPQRRAAGNPRAAQILKWRDKRMRALLLTAVLLAPGVGASFPVTVSTRGADGAPGPAALLDVAALTLEVRQLADPQYDGAKRWYRGAPLQAVFSKAPAGPGADLALLRFQNGVMIPVRFQRRDELAKLDVFVAVEFADAAPDKGGTFTSAFPPVHKPGPQAKEDRRPLKLEGNKLVVPAGWHPMVEPKAAKTFNPWRFADSLVAIEYVRELAWYGQFDYGPDTQAGLKLFRGRCQFCHGVRKVGANYGWDVAEPVALYKHRDAKSLALHARYREGDAAEKGLMMPAFPELSTAEVGVLWKWFEAAGTLPQPSYGLVRP
jgi:hypothetical protein